MISAQIDEQWRIFSCSGDDGATDGAAKHGRERAGEHLADGGACGIYDWSAFACNTAAFEFEVNHAAWDAVLLLLTQCILANEVVLLQLHSPVEARLQWSDRVAKFMSIKWVAGFKT